MARHHPGNDLLNDYVAGGLDEAVSVLVATHLALCPPCRDHVGALEAVAGALFAQRSVAVSDDLLDAVLARLDEAPPAPAPPTPPASGPDDIPLPLRRYTGPLPDVPFRRVAPGIRRFDLSMSTAQRPVALVSLKPGIVVPPHRHAAAERGLVLAGGFTDEIGHHERGRRLHPLPRRSASPPPADRRWGRLCGADGR